MTFFGPFLTPLDALTHSVERGLCPINALMGQRPRSTLWVKASSGVKKGPKNVKSRPLFLIHQTHQVIFAALFELVMVHILHRKKLDDVGAEYLTKIAGNVQKR